MRALEQLIHLGPDALSGWRSPSRSVVVSAVPPASSTLRRGDQGPAVQRLQTLLNANSRPSPHLRADGDFGPGTDRAVRAFQTSRGLTADGIVGAMTWLALQSVPGDLPGVTAVATPRVTPRPQSAPTTSSSQTPSVAPTSSGGSAASWMDIARAEIGQSEVVGQQHNRRILEYHATTTLRAGSDEIAWCASFVNWVMQQAGVTGTRSAAAASWINWGQATTAREGAIIVIRNAAAAGSSLTTSGNHVGFLVEQTERHYIVLGGNQSNQVKISQFRRSSWQLRALRWPTP